MANDNTKESIHGSTGFNIALEDEEAARNKTKKLKRTFKEEVALHQRKTLKDIERTLHILYLKPPPCDKQRTEVCSQTGMNYLDTYITPILHAGLQYLLEKRPEEPINSLVAFLLKYKEKFDFPIPTIEIPSPTISETDSILSEKISPDEESNSIKS